MEEKMNCMKYQLEIQRMKYDALVEVNQGLMIQLEKQHEMLVQNSFNN